MKGEISKQDCKKKCIAGALSLALTLRKAFLNLIHIITTAHQVL
jgi:hypothetical protein